jgi:multidrug transporter EmrE-like cation transporter
MEHYLFWPILAAFVSTTYFFMIKYYVANPDFNILVSVVALELLVIFLYYKSLKTSLSGTMYAIINGLSILMGVGFAFIFFSETLTFTDIIGICAIIFGIVLVGKK